MDFSAKREKNQNVYNQRGKNVVFGDFYGKTVEIWNRSQVKNMQIFRFLEKKNSRFRESFTKKKGRFQQFSGNFSLY